MADVPTRAQIRGARGMLNWSMIDLARAAGVSVSSVKRVEDDKGFSVSDELAGQMRGALEAEGVLFLFDHGEGAGLRLKLPAGVRQRR